MAGVNQTITPGFGPDVRNELVIHFWVWSRCQDTNSHHSKESGMKPIITPRNQEGKQSSLQGIKSDMKHYAKYIINPLRTLRSENRFAPDHPERNGLSLQPLSQMSGVNRSFTPAFGPDARREMSFPPGMWAKRWSALLHRVRSETAFGPDAKSEMVIHTHMWFKRAN